MRTKRRNQLRKGNHPKKQKNPSGNASMSRWKRREDIELDEEDACTLHGLSLYISNNPSVHENRDRILLEGEEVDSSDNDLRNEVFALGNLHEDSESSEEEFGELPGETDEAEIEQLKAPKAKKATIAPVSKTPFKDLVAPSSESSSESEGRYESWGRKRSAYYSTNTAAIESDDEEAQRLEEAEVIKLQRQARSELEEDDFGVNDPPPPSTDQ